MKKVIYITMMACLAAGMLVACNDELVPQNSTHNSDIIGFSLECNEDSEQSRSNGVKQPFSGVLAMTADDSAADSLYLHTSYTNMIAMPEVKGKQKVESRGTPVTKDNFGTEFTVFAYTNVNNSTRQYMNEVTVTKGTNDVWTPSQAFYWTENDLDFFAYRQDLNASHNIEYNSDGDTKEATFSYTVPKSQDGTVDATVQPDIMMAFNTCGKGDNNGVASLNFTHALAAVKFEIHVPITGKIKTVTIEGIKGSGSCVFDGTKAISTPDNASDDYVWTTSGSNASYTQTFNLDVNKEQMDATGEKVELTTEANSATTFMLIPQTLGADAKVTVVMEDSENNVTHTFTGKIGGEGLKWEAGKTYTYLISKDAVVWNYFFEVTPTVEFALVEDITKNFSVTSYKQTASADKTIPLKWAVTNFADIPQEVDENGVASDNGAGVNSTTKPEWLSEFTITGTGNVAENTVTIVPQKINSTYAGDITMQNNPTKGEEKDPWDLSTHKHDGTTRARCTANCYIVHSAGTYAIPLVYGNAIYNGQPNPSAYTYQYTGTYNEDPDMAAYPETDYIIGNASHKFHDHQSDAAASTGITQPYISIKDGGKYDVHDAVMLWQDAYNIVEKGSVSLCTTQDGIQALQFTLNPNFMQQGNIVFAVRDANGTILWSWHIWVYDHNYNYYYELENYKNLLSTTDNRAYKDNYKFATGNLGHCMAKTLTIPAEKAIVTFTQYEIDNNATVTNDMTVTLQGKNFNQARGNNTYYQWGRKDPMVGVQNDNETLKEHYTDPDKTQYKYSIQEKQASIAESIQNPTVFYSNNKTGADPLRYDDWVINSNTNSGYLNLWNNFHYYHSRSCYQYYAEDGTMNGRKLKANQDTDEYAEKIDNNNTKVIKTVYDPCPVGFKMPPAAAFRSISKFGNGTWMPIKENLDVFSFTRDTKTNEIIAWNGYSIISLETLYQTGANSLGVNAVGTLDDVLNDNKHPLTNVIRSSYRFIWVSDGGWKLRTSYAETNAKYYNYLRDNMFKGGYQSFTEGGVTTARFYINAINSNISSVGHNLQMSIESTGQRSYGSKAGGSTGMSNLAPEDVYLWTGDVISNVNSMKNCNVAVSLLLQKNASYQENCDASGNIIIDGYKYNTKATFTAAKAMARPIRPMWDEDFNEGLR